MKIDEEKLAHALKCEHYDVALDMLEQIMCQERGELPAILHKICLKLDAHVFDGLTRQDMLDEIGRLELACQDKDAERNTFDCELDELKRDAAACNDLVAYLRRNLAERDLRLQNAADTVEAALRLLRR